MLKIELVDPHPIEIGGKKRSLLYTHASWVAFEMELGIKSYMSYLQAWMAGEDDGKVEFQMSGRELSALLWCGFLHEDPQFIETGEASLRADEVGGWFTTQHIQSILTEVLQAISKQSPEGEKKTSKATIAQVG